MRLFRMIAGFAALVSLAWAGAAPAAERENWTAKVTVLDDGSHVLGNPDAKVRLTEFVSYTCPHCAAFELEAEAPMRLAYVMPGKLSVRVQHVIRDRIDLTVAMLTNCGDPAGFFMRHQIFLSGQEKWLEKANSLTAAQRKRWEMGDIPSRLRAIASDLDFYGIMAHRGYSISAVDRCLADRDMAQKLTAQSADAARIGVTGTPSFALDGLLLAGTHTWPVLDIQIKARL